MQGNQILSLVILSLNLTVIYSSKLQGNNCIIIQNEVTIGT